MGINTSKIVPTAFWIGLLALGFATNVVGPEKDRAALRRTADAAKTADIAPDRALPPTARSTSR